MSPRFLLGDVMKIAICTPTTDRPLDPYLDSLEASAPALTAEGWEHQAAFEVGSPYISHARITAMGKALRWGADVLVFIDHDVSWRPQDLVRLVQTEADVVGGTYRFKIPEQDGTNYMGKVVVGPNGRPMVREDGCIAATCLPAGFLKVTRKAVERFMDAYPHLIIDADGFRNVDLFNHGAHKGVWFGEDYAFCRNWRDLGGEVWLLPDLQLDHHNRDGAVWPGNFHEHLLMLGSKRG